jgi:hypothetical protein
MTAADHSIEAAFRDEYARLRHDGVDALLTDRTLAELLYLVYRRGWIRGHAARSREVQQDEERDRRAGKYPQHVAITYDGDRLILDGRDATPTKEDDRGSTR